MKMGLKKKKLFMTLPFNSFSGENINPWFSTSELIEYFGISMQELDEKRNLFNEGFHFVRESAEDPKSRVLWRIDRVDEVLCIPIPPLEREAMLNALSNRITCNE